MQKTEHERSSDIPSNLRGELVQARPVQSEVWCHDVSPTAAGRREPPQLSPQSLAQSETLCCCFRSNPEPLAMQISVGYHAERLDALADAFRLNEDGTAASKGRLSFLTLPCHFRHFGFLPTASTQTDQRAGTQQSCTKTYAPAANPSSTSL